MHQDRSSYLKESSQLAAKYRSKLNEIVTKIGWNYRSLSHHEPTNVKNSELTSAETDRSVNDEIPPRYQTDFNSEFEFLGTNEQGTSSEKQYNELLASLSSVIPLKKVKEKTEEQRLAEILEKERNAKRRRVNYKNKIHTKNKSTTEVIRELVNLQMDFLMESANDTTQETPNLPHSQEQVDSKDLELIPVSLSGNPHLVWQKVSLLPEMNRENSSQETSRRRRNVSPEANGSRRRRIRGFDEELRDHSKHRRDRQEQGKLHHGDSVRSRSRRSSRSEHRSHSRKRSKNDTDKAERHSDDGHKRNHKHRSKKSRKSKKRSRGRDTH